jgi:hypothetical protein
MSDMEELKIGQLAKAFCLNSMSKQYPTAYR